ncbi:hypothetical protein RB195_000344 [Necator americanus]|uniref:LRAT domain-containing protein n=1 Tax=Necator americanus TaxID=51031 RepID=A0ABR1DC77_NECAM
MLAAGQLVSEWIPAQEIERFLELGDLVEFRRVATIGGAPRAIYTHWALYIGRHDETPLVVHLSGDDNDFEKFGRSGDRKLDSFSGSSGLLKASTAEVRCDPLLAVAGDDLVRINNGHDADHRPFPPRIIVERATMQLGSGNYNLVLNNCEHFVKWCRYGNRISGQAVAAKSLLLGSALAAMGAPPMVAFGAGIAFLTFATPASKMYSPEEVTIWKMEQADFCFIFAFASKVLLNPSKMLVKKANKSRLQHNRQMTIVRLNSIKVQIRATKLPTVKNAKEEVPTKQAKVIQFD